MVVRIRNPQCKLKMTLLQKFVRATVCIESEKILYLQSVDQYTSTSKNEPAENQ